MPQKSKYPSGKHPNSKANLKKFGKDKSPLENNHGKPKGPNVQTIIQRLLNSKIKLDGGRQPKDLITGEAADLTGAEILLYRAFGMAVKGNLKAVEMLLNRAEGMPNQPMSIDGSGIVGKFQIEGIESAPLPEDGLKADEDNETETEREEE